MALRTSHRLNYVSHKVDTILLRLSQLREPTFQNLIQVIDILLVAGIVYKILTMIRGSRAWRIVGGIVMFILALSLSQALKLTTLHTVLDRATLLAPVALVILLLPELRQGLEGLGKIGMIPQRLGLVEEQAEARTVEELVAAVAEMSATRVGALIVLERGVPLDEIVANGVQLDAKVSAPLLVSIFFDGNPLHDGAAIVRKDTIVAAACRLPLSESSKLDSHLHMRHRAAVGVSEQVDCISVVVSEERGTISIVVDGELRRLSSHAELREILNKSMRDSDKPTGRRRRKEVANVKS